MKTIGRATAYARSGAECALKQKDLRQQIQPGAQRKPRLSKQCISIAKIFALVASYLGLAAWGVFLILPSPASGAQNANKSGEKNIPVFIVPHHLVADKQIRDGFAYIASAWKNNPPKRIILMGPNHYFRGKADVITARHNWNTNDGDITADTAFIDLMAKKNFAALEDGIVEGDHSITALLPFVKRFFPDASLVPLLMREPMLRKNTDKLAQFFHEQLGQETLLIVSADFSHYFPKEIAEEHDRQSLIALQNLDMIFMEKQMDVDARQILMVVAQYLELKGNAKFTMLFHTNSADLTANPREKSTTSHFVGFYEL